MSAKNRDALKALALLVFIFAFGFAAGFITANIEIVWR